MFEDVPQPMVWQVDLATDKGLFRAAVPSGWEWLKKGRHRSDRKLMGKHVAKTTMGDGVTNNFFRINGRVNMRNQL